MSKFEIRQVFEENYERFRRFLHARFHSLNEYDVEDLIQQSVMNLLYKGDGLSDIRNMTSYLYASLENGAKDFFKKRKKETLTAEEIDEQTQDVEEEILTREQKRAVMDAIDKLDDKQRYVFVETEIKGRSYEELSKESGEKIGTLLSRKSRAAKKLKDMMYEYMKEEKK